MLRQKAWQALTCFLQRPEADIYGNHATMGKHVNMLLSQKYTQLPEMFRVAAVSLAVLTPTLHRFICLLLSPLPSAEQLGVTQAAVLLCAGTSPPVSSSEQPTRLLPSTPPAFTHGCVPLNSLLFLLGALPSCTLLDSLSPCTASPYPWPSRPTPSAPPACHQRPWAQAQGTGTLNSGRVAPQPGCFALLPQLPLLLFPLWLVSKPQALCCLREVHGVLQA